MATLTTLVSFNGTDGQGPLAGLMSDAAGDLFGTTDTGGPNDDGTVFEIAKTASGYASTPTTLVNFNSTNGAYPQAGLIADAAGDLFGTTDDGGPNNDGTVFEIAKTASGYATTPTTLVSFNSTNGLNPETGLIADAAGDLFGTTYRGGSYISGTVFEIAKTASGYASTPTTLVNFNSTDGEYPEAGLIADAAGDLFGTTAADFGGPNDDGTVFEIAKTASGYASTPTTLVNFNSTDGASPQAGLIADAAGDLFGTTYDGGPNEAGTVFEIAKTASGYASTPTTLVNFNSTNGAYPQAGLIADAAGDLFGTTLEGGANGEGTVFEIAKTASGYASTLTTLVSFNSTNGAYPQAGLIADAAGDLYGTTSDGGANGVGTVFEITNSGFAPAAKGSANFTVTDATTGQTTTNAGQAYSGPVAGLTSEFILPTTDQVTMTSGIPNVFIQVGVQGQSNPVLAGINVATANGNNVLDSYANSSFLTDGTGTDQNYLDARALTQNQWDTVANFHSGDNITLWGVTQADFSLDWIGDTQGATGYTGLTGVYVPAAAGQPEAAVTLAGFKLADLTNGSLAITYDTINGTPYASIHAT